MIRCSIVALISSFLLSLLCKITAVGTGIVIFIIIISIEGLIIIASIYCYEICVCFRGLVFFDENGNKMFPAKQEHFWLTRYDMGAIVCFGKCK